LGDFVDEVPDC
jgi:predicted glycosyltransferase